MFKFMYNPLSDMPCYNVLLFFKLMLIQKIFSPPWQFLISLLTLHSSLLFSLRMFFPFFLGGDYFTEYSTQSCVIDSHKSILTPMILFTIPFLICLNILFFFFFFFDYSCTLSRSCLWTCCTPSLLCLLCWCLQQQSH